MTQPAVLIVEDDANLREALFDTLSSDEQPVLTADSGPAALEIIDSALVGLVVSDLQMEPMDGATLLEEIRARHPGLPAVLMTAYGTIESAVNIMQKGASDYLVKPFDTRWRIAEDVMAGLFWMAAAPQEAAREARRSPETAPPISMFDKAANVDEFNVAYAAGRLGARRVSTRIMVVLADGMTRGSVQALADSVEAVEQSGAIVLGIGIGDQTVQAAYSRNQVVEMPEELAVAMVDGVRSTLYKTIAVMGGNTWWAHTSEQVLYDPSTLRSANV